MTEKEIFQFQAEEAEEINLKEVLMKYLRHWYLFVIGVIICVALAFLYLRYVTPQYNISSTLLIKDDKKGPDMAGNAAFADLDLFNTSKNIDNEIEVLKSKSLMQRVFKELALNTSYYVKGRINDVEIYGRDLPMKVIVSQLDSTAFDKVITLHIKDNNSFALEEEDGVTTSHKFGQEIHKPYGVFTVVASGLVASQAEKMKHIIVEFHDIRKFANYYNTELLTVSPVNKDASVLTISLKEPIPERGKDIINKLIEVYNREAIEDKNLEASNTIAFIDDRMKFLTAELSDVEKDVEQYKRKNEITDVTSEAGLYLEKASEYNKQLSELEIQIDVLGSIENYLNKQVSQLELVPSTLNIQDPTLLGLIAKFNELQLDRERMLRTTQPNNPLVLNITDQLSNLKLNILENLRNIKSGLTITRDNLQASSVRFESKIQKVPSIERELLEINRQQSIKEGLYLYLLQKREESALSLAATVSNSRVIDPAMVGDEPISPKKRLIYLMALVFGLGLPFAFIYVRDMLNDKVQQMKEVEQATATPILGELAHDKSGETVVVTKDNQSAIVEMFRLIRANLQFATVGKDNKVIMVTSSMSGEGKTFFSINLGASLVQAGKKVVVLGLDLRKPRLMQDLGLSADSLGVTNYLIDDSIFIDDLIKPVQQVPDLFVIGSGPIPPNPAELMMSAKLGYLIDKLRERFDHIIIDTAPVGQVADAFTLAPYMDSTIYLVRYNYTYKNQIEIVDNIYKEKKLNHPMIVLNDAKKKNSYGYGYGYGYEHVNSKRKSTHKLFEKSR